MDRALPTGPGADAGVCRALRGAAGVRGDLGAEAVDLRGPAWPPGERGRHPAPPTGLGSAAGVARERRGVAGETSVGVLGRAWDARGLASRLGGLAPGPSRTASAGAVDWDGGLRGVAAVRKHRGPRPSLPMSFESFEAGVGVVDRDGGLRCRGAGPQPSLDLGTGVGVVERDEDLRCRGAGPQPSLDLGTGVGVVERDEDLRCRGAGPQPSLDLGTGVGVVERDEDLRCRGAGPQPSLDLGTGVGVVERDEDLRCGDASLGVRRPERGRVSRDGDVQNVGVEGLAASGGRCGGGGGSGVADRWG